MDKETHPLLLGQVKGDGGLDGLDLLGLALVHDLGFETSSFRGRGLRGACAVSADI